jgi:hypothetical protein
VGPWVGEMADEVGDSIWSLVKEEAHQRSVSTGAQLGKVVGTRAVVRVASTERVGGRRRLGSGRCLEQNRCTVGGGAERTRQERWSRDGRGEVKKSGFASEPRRTGDKDARGGARGRPR